MPAPKPTPGVGGPPRARRGLLARVLVENVGMLVEPCVELLEIRGTALTVADRIELQLVAAHAEVPQQRVVELDPLRVGRGVGGADVLERELPVLAVAAALRLVVAVHRGDREELHGLWLALHAVL